jgi:single-stranded DNA-binding protein
MSALALISGKLASEPLTRPTKTGGEVTFFKLRVANGAALEWWDIVTFSDTVRGELEGLGEGSALSAVGALHVETYEHKGEMRIKRALTADRVLALKPRRKEASRRTGPELAAPSWAAPK